MIFLSNTKLDISIAFQFLWNLLFLKMCVLSGSHYASIERKPEGTTINSYSSFIAYFSMNLRFIYLLTHAIYSMNSKNLAGSMQFPYLPHIKTLNFKK